MHPYKDLATVQRLDCHDLLIANSHSVTTQWQRPAGWRSGHAWTHACIHAQIIFLFLFCVLCFGRDATHVCPWTVKSFFFSFFLDPDSISSYYFLYLFVWVRNPKKRKKEVVATLFPLFFSPINEWPFHGRLLASHFVTHSYWWGKRKLCA
jgi:hypothetical protein